jgi:methyl-accepting chemotaxis protein
MQTMTISKKLFIGFSLGPIVLLIVGWIAYNNTAQLLEARKLVVHSHEIIESTETLMSDMLDAETGQRGYLLTGDERYLAPYQSAVASIQQHILAISSLAAENTKLLGHLQALRSLVTAKLDELGTTVGLRKEKGFDAALQIVLANKGKQMMEDIRGALQAISDDEKKTLDVRDADAVQISQLTFNTITYGTLFSFLLLAIGGFSITRSITGPVRNAVHALSSATAEILAGTTQQASGMQEQAAAVAQTMSTVDEIVQTAEQSNQRAKAVSDASARAVEVGTAGQNAIGDSVAVMDRVKAQTESIAESILRLSEQAQAIAEIIAAVNDVADQTKLLALNAAIEASRAGEHGRGFSVVAGEIKALAEQSKKATVQVRQILGEIQKATNSAVMATEEGSRSVRDAIKTVNLAGATINSLADTIAEAAQSAAQISASVGQQSVGMAQIQGAMQNINQATHQNLASTKQAEQAAQDLDLLGGKLRTLLAGSVS